MKQLAARLKSTKPLTACPTRMKWKNLPRLLLLRPPLKSPRAQTKVRKKNATSVRNAAEVEVLGPVNVVGAAAVAVLQEDEAALDQKLMMFSRTKMHLQVSLTKAQKQTTRSKRSQGKVAAGTGKKIAPLPSGTKRQSSLSPRSSTTSSPPWESSQRPM